VPGLQVQVADTAIAVKSRLPGEVVQGRCVAGSELVVEAVTEIMVVIRKSSKLLVATAAGKVAIFGKLSVVKQFLAEGKTSIGNGVGIEIIHRGRPPVGCLENDGFGDDVFLFVAGERENGH